MAEGAWSQFPPRSRWDCCRTLWEVGRGACISLRKASGEKTHSLCHSSCDRAKLALRRARTHRNLWELSRGLGLPFPDFPADGKSKTVTVGEHGVDLPHPVHPSEQGCHSSECHSLEFLPPLTPTLHSHLWSHSRKLSPELAICKPS